MFMFRGKRVTRVPPVGLYLPLSRALQAQIENPFFLQVITAEAAPSMLHVSLHFHRGGDVIGISRFQYCPLT